MHLFLIVVTKLFYDISKDIESICMVVVGYVTGMVESGLNISGADDSLVNLFTIG